MSEMPPDGAPRPFTAAEIEGAPEIEPHELAAGTRIARELEAIAARTPVKATPGFVDRVMEAVAAEPAPAPARLAVRSLRRGSLGGFLASIRDAWRVSVSPRFPMAARAQAMALVLVIAGLAAGSSMAAAGALGLLDGDHPGPSVEQVSQPIPDASELESSPPETTDESASPESSESPEPSESTGVETPEPGDSAEPAETEDQGGSGGGRATATPESGDNHDGGASRTPSPTETPDDDHEDSGSTPEPTWTPGPSQSSSDSSGSGGGDS